MIRRRGNPNWGKPLPNAAIVPSSFESVVKMLGLSPRQYEGSDSLKIWVIKNKHNKYVPQDLLQAWGMDAPSEA
jgi:hypothetical protein